MTVAQLMHGISNREYVDWQALAIIENAEREAEGR
jgi:hypothetical protein